MAAAGKALVRMRRGWRVGAAARSHRMALRESMVSSPLSARWSIAIQSGGE
jgi:hypothetical protein